MRISTLDPHFGRIYFPRSQTWLTQGEGNMRPIYYRYNSFGLRGPEIPPKDPNLYRILILGDSVTDGQGVDEDKVFGRRLEELLNQGLPRRRYEVISGGVSGWGTDSELLYLRYRAKEIRPDLILLTFYMGNDLSDNTYELRQPEGAPWDPYFELTPDHRNLILRNFPVPVEKYLPGRLKSWLGAYCYVWCEFIRPIHDSALLQSWFRRSGMSMSPLSNPHAAAYQFYPLNQAWYASCESCLAHRDGLWSKAWTITGLLLDEVKKEAAAQGVRFGMIISPHREAVVLRSAQELVEQFPVPRNETWDLSLPYRRIDALTKSKNIPALDAWKPFHEFPDPEMLYWPHDPHLSDDGHAFMAALVKSFLVREKLIPPPR